MKRPLSLVVNCLPWLFVLVASSRCLQTAAGQPVQRFAGAPRMQLQLRQQQQQQQQQPGGGRDHHYDTGGKRAPGRVFVVDEKTGHATPLLPGLLDETLLKRGSFSFGAKQVVFNKLKVLGNVYVKNVNGKPLNEAYVFKSRRQAAATTTA